MRKVVFFLLSPMVVCAAVLRVPKEHAAIQEAIRQASNGDTVLVAPGVYHENMTIDGKSILLASHYVLSPSDDLIKKTVIDGDGETILKVNNTDTTMSIIGFTFRNGDDGISPSSPLCIKYNYFTLCDDAIDYEKGSGGLCRYNIFERNRDDAIDLDGDVDIIIENNTILDNDDDGIEVRLHPYSGPVLSYIIRYNFISGSGEDGIQLIDYPDESDRVFYIHHNIIENSAMAAIGFMSDGNTRENFEAAPIPEKAYIYNNTIVDNPYGICGGVNVLAVNNIIAHCEKTALKGVQGESLIQNNVLWQNGLDADISHFMKEQNCTCDPLLDEHFIPLNDSPCLRKGLAQIHWKDETVEFKHGESALLLIGALDPESRGLWRFER